MSSGRGEGRETSRGRKPSENAPVGAGAGLGGGAAGQQDTLSVYVATGLRGPLGPRSQVGWKGDGYRKRGCPAGRRAGRLPGTGDAAGSQPLSPGRALTWWHLACQPGTFSSGSARKGGSDGQRKRRWHRRDRQVEGVPSSVPRWPLCLQSRGVQGGPTFHSAGCDQKTGAEHWLLCLPAALSSDGIGPSARSVGRARSCYAV